MNELPVTIIGKSQYCIGLVDTWWCLIRDTQLKSVIIVEFFVNQNFPLH